MFLSDIYLFNLYVYTFVYVGGRGMHAPQQVREGQSRLLLGCDPCWARESAQVVGLDDQHGYLLSISPAHLELLNQDVVHPKEGGEG